MKINSLTSMEELAAIVTNHLRQKHIEVVLVGGFAVACYTRNRYLTRDIDLVDISYSSSTALSSAMAELGFYKQGRVFVNDKTGIVVEFPAAPLSVGDELIQETTDYVSPYGNIPILKLQDVVKDRLAAYFHWKDKQSLVQALCIMLEHKLEPKIFSEFAKKEGTPESIVDLQNIYTTLTQKRLIEIEDIESNVTHYFLNRIQ